MRILGFSGFHNSIDFKRAHWPGLDPSEYRISQGHDAAAALVVDGEVVACAAEERFNGQKATPAFPIGAITYCLRQAGIEPGEIDEVAHCFDYSPYEAVFASGRALDRYRRVYSRQAVVTQVLAHLPGLAQQRIFNVEHHLCHASSAYLTSGWDECLVIVLDGMGELHSTSVWHAARGQVRNLDRLTVESSIGILFSLVTLHLGFDYNSDEYKVMGLAPYGDPRRFGPIFDELVELGSGGSFSIPALMLNTSPDEFETWSATRAYLISRLGPPRQAGEPLTQTHRDIAAALQGCLNRVLLHVASHYRQQTGQTRLAMAGGVALNCSANGSIYRAGIFDDVYVQPAAGDDGAALGAALHRAAAHGEARNRRLPAPFLGPAYDRSRVERAIDRFEAQVDRQRFETPEATVRAAAASVARGEVIAWYRGRMEFGPRALGNRSILADPGHPEMRDRINRMVKKREEFRPFAPAVALEEVHRWFDVRPGTSLPYMLFVVNVRPEHRKSLPAITHVDGSARVQTVHEQDNPDFYRLLVEVGKLTGRRMVLNTSFNVKGQPMVNTPEEAIQTSLATQIDALFLEDNLVRPKLRRT